MVSTGLTAVCDLLTPRYPPPHRHHRRRLEPVPAIEAMRVDVVGVRHQRDPSASRVARESDCGVDQLAAETLTAPCRVDDHVLQQRDARSQRDRKSVV